VAADDAARVAERGAGEQAARAAQRGELDVETDDVVGAGGELGDDAADAAAELDGERDARAGAAGDAIDELAGAERGAVGRRVGAVAPLRVEVDRELVGEVRIGRVLAAVLEQQRRDLGRQLALDDASEVGRAVREQDRDPVDDRVAPAARARGEIASALERANVDTVVGARATARADQMVDRRILCWIWPDLRRKR
jgi:hypothetical protein